MLDLQFIGLNLHFAINLLIALVTFAVFWLIFDAWTLRHERREIFKWAGFLALSVGFMLRATDTQAQAAGIAQLVAAAADWLRLAGYASIIAGQLLDPLQKRPEYADPFADLEADQLSSAKAVADAGGTKTGKAPKREHHAVWSLPLIGLVLPLAALTAGLLYWRRATTGLERHLGPVAGGFMALTVFELLANAATLQGTANPNLYRLVQTYGLVWWLSLAALTLAALILGRWVWHYLTKRLQSQLFIILVTQTLVLFLFSTVGFTFLLLQNVQKQSLADLSTASHVLDYAVSSKQAEAEAQAEAVAGNSAVAAHLVARNHTGLATALADYLPKHGLTTLTVLDATGQVWLRGEDPDRWGDSRSSDPLVRRAIIGESSSSVVVQSGVAAPTVTLVAANPIRDAGGTIVGVAVTGRAITGAFVDGIRASTGLDSAVYGGNVRAATTLVTGDSHSRAIGIKETSTAVSEQVLVKDKSYSGVVDLQNRAYLAAFSPLRDVNNGPVGMLLVARPKAALYAAANTSVQFTFIFVALLVFVSIYPVYRISRFLSNQLK